MASWFLSPAAAFLASAKVASAKALSTSSLILGALLGASASSIKGRSFPALRGGSSSFSRNSQTCNVSIVLNGMKAIDIDGKGVWTFSLPLLCGLSEFLSVQDPTQRMPVSLVSRHFALFSGTLRMSVVRSCADSQNGAASMNDTCLSRWESLFGNEV